MPLYVPWNGMESSASLTSTLNSLLNLHTLSPAYILDILHIAIVNYCFSFSLSCQPRPNFYSLAQVEHISVLYPCAESELLVTRTHIKPVPWVESELYPQSYQFYPWGESELSVTRTHIKPTPGMRKIRIIRNR